MWSQKEWPHHSHLCLCHTQCCWTVYQRGRPQACSCKHAHNSLFTWEDTMLTVCEWVVALKKLLWDLFLQTMRLCVCMCALFPEDRALPSTLSLLIFFQSVSVGQCVKNQTSVTSCHSSQPWGRKRQIPHQILWMIGCPPHLTADAYCWIFNKHNLGLLFIMHLWITRRNHSESKMQSKNTSELDLRVIYEASYADFQQRDVSLQGQSDLTILL